MIHLNEEQLVAVLYEDLELSEYEILRRHVDECEDCKQRLREMSLVTRFLDSSGQDSGSVNELAREKTANLDLQTIIENYGPANFGNVLTIKNADERNRSHSGFRAAWIGTGIAVAVLVMATTAGFFFGAQYQERRISGNLDQSFGVLEQRLNDSLQHWLLERDSSNGQTIDERLLARLESALSSLVSEQKLLRIDLQSLAVNAESEILFTNRELHLTKEALSRLQRIAGISH